MILARHIKIHFKKTNIEIMKMTLTLTLKLSNGQILEGLTFKKLKTFNDRFLIRMLYTLAGVNKIFLFYASPDGSKFKRFLSKNEINNVPDRMIKKLPNPHLPSTEWNWAKKEWGSEQEKLSREEKTAAMELAKSILENPLFGFPFAVTDKVERALMLK